MTNRKAVALLIALIAIAYADILLLGRGFYTSDVSSYHYPMKKVVRDVVSRGEMPYWNRFNFAGQPMAANPAYELWYPPQWLIFLPSFHYGFQLHVIVHFLIAAIGMFVLLRSFDASIPASLFGALVFAFSGPYLSMTSKLPPLFSYSWMPLTLYFVRALLSPVPRNLGTSVPRSPRNSEEPRNRGTEEPQSKWSFTNLAGASIAAGMQLIIGEPTVILQTWLLITAYLVWRWRTARADVPRVFLVGVLAMLVAAAQLIPAFDFVPDTVRTQPFPFAIVSNWSMPLIRPIEMIFPSIFNHVAGEGGHARMLTMYAYRTEPYVNEIYLGIFAGILALAGVLTRKAGTLKFVVLFGIAYILAAGEHTPLLQFIYDLNIGRTLRYPEKFVLSAAFVAIVWAALMFDRVRTDARLARAAMILASLVALWAFFAMLGASVSPLNLRTYAAVQLARAIVVLAFLGPLRKRLSEPVWTSLVIALTTADLIVSTRKVADRMPRDYFTPPQLAASLPANDRVFHEAAWDVWTPTPNALQWGAGLSTHEYWRRFRAALFPNLPVLHGRPMAFEEDIDRTSLKTTDELRELYKRLRNEGQVGREQQLLRTANIRWRVRFLPFDPASDMPVTVEPLDGYPRYAFADELRRADFETSLDRSGNVLAVADIAPFPLSPGTVTSAHETDNSIRLTTSNAGRGLLLIVVTAHKYWRATIDGKPATLIPANVAYQALDVPPGTHTIELRYRNPLVIPSAIVSLVTIVALLALATWRRANAGTG